MDFQAVLAKASRAGQAAAPKGAGMQPYYEEKGIQIWLGDCRDLLQRFCAAGFDAFVTDPQYGIGENYASGCDDLTNVDCGLWALTYLRGTAGTGAITPG